MFPFHPFQQEIKIDKWIFFRTREKDFWGELTGFSCSMWDRGGMWASHGTEDTLIFLPPPKGREERTKLPPPKITEQARQDEQGTKENKKKSLKTLAATIILALLG